jgi:hypothetical protein
MKPTSFWKAVVWAALLVNFAQALQPPFDAIHEARKRNAHKKRQLSGTFAGAITGFSLIDTATDTKVAHLSNGTVIYVTNRTNSFSINASFAGSGIGSVKFGHNGNSNVHIENYAWYSFCGNVGKDFFNCSVLGIGNHTVTATPYSEPNAGGKAGAPYKVSFSIVSNKTKVPAPTSAPVSAFVPVPSGPSGPPSRQYKPRFNLTALSPLKVNVTRGPVMVELRVAVEANRSIAELYLEAFRGRPSDLAYQITNYCSAPRAQVAGPLICNMSLTFPRYIPPGSYSLQLSGYSSKTYDYFVISSTDLKNRKLPNVVEVVNNIADTTPPQLLDLKARSPTTVNVTTRRTSVDLVVVVKDDLSQFRNGYVQAIDSKGDPQAEAYFSARAFPYNNSVAGKPLTFNTSIYLSNYNRPGKYSLQVFLSDNIGNTMEINADSLAKRAFLSSIAIINADYDGTPPVILKKIEISPTSVNVTLRPATIDIKLLVQDDISGVQSAWAQLFGPTESEEDFGLSAEYYLEAPVAGKAVPISMRLVVPRYTRSGRYELSLQVSDVRGNNLSYNSDGANKNKTVFINIFNALEDVSPPILKKIEISPSSVNVTLRPATIDIELLVQDDTSGVESADASLMIPTGFEVYQSLSAYYYSNFPVAGTPVPISMSLEVPRFTRSGRYELSLRVNDVRGNTLSYNSDGASKTLFIDIFNTLEDVSPPKLLSLVARTPTTVNASSALRSVKYEVVVQDDLSGITGVYLSAYLYGSLDGSSSIYDPIFSGYQETPIAGQPAKFIINLEAKQSTKPGKYLLDLSLRDAAGNYDSLNAERLAAMNVSTAIVVVNPEYDGFPPELKDLVLLSSSKVNVSLAPAKIDLQLLVQDDISGFKYGTVELYTPNIPSIDGGEVAPAQMAGNFGVARRASGGRSGIGKERRLSDGPESYYAYMIANANFTASTKVAGKARAYNVSLTIPKFVMPGTYVLNVILFDFADNARYFDSSMLSRLSFPSKINVSNKIVDSEPPVLVSFTTRSPLVVNVTSGPVTVTFQAVAFDALSGVQFGYGGISGPGKSYDFENFTEVKFDAPIAGKPVPFNISFTLEPNLRSGVYSLAVAVMDATFQYIELFSKDLKSRGFVGNLTVVSGNM